MTLEGEARFGGRWGKLEVDLKLGSPTSAAALLSELLRSKLISGARVHNHNCFCLDHRQRINWPTFAEIEISPRSSCRCSPVRRRPGLSRFGKKLAALRRA